MPICKNCGNTFPVRIRLEGKERNLCRRKYCLICSPFGKHNTRPIEDQSALFTCQICGRQYFYNRSDRGGHRRTKCNSCNVNTRRFALKTRAIEYKGGGCQKCGYNKCKAAMVFHHLNPKEKDFTISSNHCLSWEKIAKELDKCILLCLNCHAEMHEEMKHAPVV